MIKTHDELLQGSDEWLQIRCGLLTASELKLLITPTLKKSNNDKSRAHTYEILAQQITNYTEPTPTTFDMERGNVDEIYARETYSEKYDKAVEVGFVTNDQWGFTLGFSPDGLVGDDGLIEIKSRKQKHQVKTILEDVCPSEYMIQVQTGLLVTNRKWCDFISYSGGLPMFVKRVLPDEKIQRAIIAASDNFYYDVAEKKKVFFENSKSFIKTERINESEITL